MQLDIICRALSKILVGMQVEKYKEPESFRISRTRTRIMQVFWNVLVTPIYRQFACKTRIVVLLHNNKAPKYLSILQTRCLIQHF